MATKIKIVTAKDFFKVTPDGVIDMSTSKQLLIDIAKAERSPADYDLLVDFRDSRWKMSTLDIYELASQLCKHGDTFRGRVALLVLPGTDFDAASFLETCSHNRGFFLDAFTDFETAISWFLSEKDQTQKDSLPNK
ncbi:hypothetical protein BVX94_03595 [bacterium B17]|nr:hypothetical protein BVX94_03595 [bacterium B17]